MPVTTGLQTVGFGSNTKISYLVQAAAGVIGATPKWIVVPFASGEMTVQAEQISDNSITGDRNEREPRSGTVNGQMTLSGKFRPECFDGLLEAAAQGTWTKIGATTEDALLVGSTQRRVAWEIYHSDTDEYVRMVDTEISNFSLSLNANGEVTFDMTAIGGTELDLGLNIGTKITGATYTETSEPFYDTFNGTISLQGETGIYFSSMTPTINNQSTPLFALGSRYPFAIVHGKMMGDMSLTAYYTDETIKSKYQNETSLDLTVKIMNEDVGVLEDITTFYHQIKWPSTKIISFGRPVSGEGALMDNLTVKPYKDSSLGSSFQIIRNIPRFVATDVPQTETDALMNFFYVTDGPNWTNNTGWGVDPVVGNWYGITVENDHVTGLALRANRATLSGPGVPFLVALSELTYLNLFSAKVTGDISGFYVLDKLTHMSLTNPGVTGDISGLVNLTTLYLVSTGVTVDTTPVFVKPNGSLDIRGNPAPTWGTVGSPNQVTLNIVANLKKGWTITVTGGIPTWVQNMVDA